MVFLLKAPQLDANDDEMTVVELCVEEGQYVTSEDEVVVIESSKTTMALEAETNGYVRKILVQVDDEITVGTPLVIIADTTDEIIDESALLVVTVEESSVVNSGHQISYKAKLLADKVGIDLNEINPAGEKIRVEDIEKYYQNEKSDFRKLTRVPFSARKMSTVELGIMSTLKWSDEMAFRCNLAVAYFPIGKTITCLLSMT